MNLRKLLYAFDCIDFFMIMVALIVYWRGCNMDCFLCVFCVFVCALARMCLNLKCGLVLGLGFAMKDPNLIYNEFLLGKSNFKSTISQSFNLLEVKMKYFGD